MTTTATTDARTTVATRAPGRPVAAWRHEGATVANLRPFVTPVRGHAYAAPPPGDDELEEGRPVRLVREPGNPADPLAVALWAEDGATGPWRIGYLDRGVAARVAPRLDRGLRIRAEVEGWTPEPRGRWHRPLLRVVPDAADRGARDDAGLWGRPPGVARRRVGR